MARTPEGARLTQQHRATQRRIRALVMRRVQNLWPLLDPADITSTERAWMAATIDAINAGRQLSARAAVRYYEAFRLAEGGGGAAPLRLAGPVSNAQAVASLHVTGPGRLLRAAGRGDVAASSKGLSGVLGSAARLALAGGRESLAAMIAADSAASGYARVAGGGACAFCAMLASRGPVYSTDVEFDPPDNCDCSVEAVIGGEAGYGWPPNSRAFQRQWEQAGSLNELRRLRTANATAAVAAPAA